MLTLCCYRHTSANHMKEQRMIVNCQMTKNQLSFYRAFSLNQQKKMRCTCNKCTENAQYI